MKKLTASLLIAVSLAGASSGCSSWLSNFQSNPVEQVQETLSGVETLIGIAQGIFAQVLPSIPASASAGVQATFNGLIQDARNAEVAVQDAITTVQQNNSGTIDLTTLMAGIGTTATAIQTFVDGLKSQFSLAAVIPSSLDQQATVVHRTVTLYHNPR